MLASFAILALATVEGEAPLAYIVGMVALFAVGRITFRRGYPQGAPGRAFGIVTTLLPTYGAFAWVIFDMLAGLLQGGRRSDRMILRQLFARSPQPKLRPPLSSVE